MITSLLDLPLILQIGVFVMVASTFVYSIFKWKFNYSAPHVDVKFLKKPYDEEMELDKMLTKGGKRQILYFRVTSKDRRNLRDVGVKLTFDKRCVVHSGVEYERLDEGKKLEPSGVYSTRVIFYRLRKKGESFRFPIVLTPLIEIGDSGVDVEVSSENIRNVRNSKLTMTIVGKNDITTHEASYFQEQRYKTTK